MQNSLRASAYPDDIGIMANLIDQGYSGADLIVELRNSVNPRDSI